MSDLIVEELGLLKDVPVRIGKTIGKAVTAAINVLIRQSGRRKQREMTALSVHGARGELARSGPRLDENGPRR
ncbi:MULTISPECIES: hypothetical protein [Bradyrhizobium]|uniref:Uncharacterized protein n=1 Tax=Bradyrhizobium vignae TaxID=1549949 RepID=A0A2U3PSF3_9BRAD|nr:hypothetical protein [Bradyrhizobium vignae]MBP0111112.1 hypothetical protein [Bradyrhizobium vignae]RXG88770.1 hypothetical protein EAV90_30535 [Bradyrhizobium vignae]SPP92066.1 protein of unknown function [Bradyrhizobium vignae]